MGRELLLVIMNFLIFEVTCIDLLANYKFWDSMSNLMAYDYSGNHNHGIYGGTYKFTDRGFCDTQGGVLRLPKNTWADSPGYHNSTTSFWFLYNVGKLDLFLYGDPTSFHPNFNIIGSDTILTVNARNSAGASVSAISTVSNNVYLEVGNLYLGAWKLITIQLSTDTRSTVKVYYDLRLVYQKDFPSFSSPVGIYQRYYTDHVTASYNIFYELWWHIGLSSISDLQSLISTSSECTCSNSCTTSPTILCLPNFAWTRNFNGDACLNECTSMLISCDTKNACINSRNSRCKYGLYHRETRKCMFNCPDDSCECLTTNSLSCSCKEGYVKISDNPPACITSKCLSYHKDEYKYVCDELEDGYVFGPSGECCECDTNYIAISFNPLVCLTIPHCLTYTENRGQHRCTTCSEGYKIDQDGMCSLCELGYINISTDITVCALNIQHCSKYASDETDLKCQECLEGYKLNDLNRCDDCDAGYVKVLEDSFSCKAEISRCIEYDINSQDSKCTLCETGYTIDISNKCTECESGYIIALLDPLICTVEIPRCDQYIYSENLYEWGCLLCKEGYSLDTEMKCNICDQGYQSTSSELLECVLDENPLPEDQVQTNQEQTSQEDTLSTIEQERQEIIETTSTTAIVTTAVSTSVAGIASMNPNVLISCFNTIKLLLYIQHLRINLPFEIRTEQESSNKYFNKANAFSYFMIQDQTPDDYITSQLDDANSFISQAIYQLLTLILIMMLDIIFSLLSRYGKGKLKDIGLKILPRFRYNIYVQFIMATYLDLTYSALSKITHVIHIQPKETSFLNILDYILAILCMAVSILFIGFLAKFILESKNELKKDDLLISYAFLLIDYNHTVSSVNFHLIFLVRRLCIVASIHLLGIYPYIQTVVCSLACWIVLIHMILVRPFKDKLLNAIFIGIELSVWICYSSALGLVYSVLEEETLMWSMLICIYLSYLLHSILGYYKIIKVIYPIIKTCILGKGKTPKIISLSKT